MFHADMDQLELGLDSLSPSDLLFNDAADLLSVPLESLCQATSQAAAAANTNEQQQGTYRQQQQQLNNAVFVEEGSSNIQGPKGLLVPNLPVKVEQQQQQQQDDILAQVINEIEMVPEDVAVPTATSPGAVMWPLNEDCDEEMKDLKSLDHLNIDAMLYDATEQQQQDHQQQYLSVPAVSPGASSSCLSPASSHASLGSEDETQSLIEEVEEFLVHHENRRSSTDSNNSSFADASSSSANTSGCSSADQGLVMNTGSNSVASDAADAERLLEALVKGNVSMSAGNSSGSLGLNLSNVSEIVTGDGQRIVIVIAKDDEVQQVRQALSPAPAAPIAQSVGSPSVAASVCSSAASSPTHSGSSSDSDWSPYSPVPAAPKRKTATSLKTNTAKSGSVSKARGPYNKRKDGSKPTNYRAIKDKKERKKLQNVVAARRYRDKKKNEAATVEDEEQKLSERNRELSDRATEMANEVNTLKKLMAELGLIKIGAASAK